MNQPNQQQNQQFVKDQQEQDYNTFFYKFQQQIIGAWKPIPLTKNNIILFSVILAVCGISAASLLINHQKIKQIQFKYSDQTPGDGNLITREFTIGQDMHKPIYLYYGLTNYYQNHRRYLKNFSPDQMVGNTISEKTAKDQCGQNAFKNGQIGAKISVANTPLPADEIAHPCGQRAKSFLQIKPQLDSIKLKYSNNTYVNANRTGVSWPDDSRAYKDTGNLSNQAISNTDEAWLVWFRPAAKSTFFKLHSRIEIDLPAGNYTLEVTDLFNSSFGQKWFNLSNSNYTGNIDNFLGYAFFIVGVLCLIVWGYFIAKCIFENRGSDTKSA